MCFIVECSYGIILSTERWLALTDMFCGALIDYYSFILKQHVAVYDFVMILNLVLRQ